MATLTQFVDEIEPIEPEKVEIDVSAWIGEPDGTTVFSFQEPGAAVLFQAAETGQKLAARYPGMSTRLGVMVATMALSHVRPEVGDRPVALIYADLCVKNSRLFMFLLNRFLAAFPALNDLEAQVDDAKKL